MFTAYSPDLPFYQQVDQAWLEANGKRLETRDLGRAVVSLYELNGGQ